MRAWREGRKRGKRVRTALESEMKSHVLMAKDYSREPPDLLTEEQKLVSTRDQVAWGGRHRYNKQQERPLILRDRGM